MMIPDADFDTSMCTSLPYQARPHTTPPACVHTFKRTTTFLIFCAVLAWGIGPATAETPQLHLHAAPSGTPIGCPAPGELESKHLYGQWQADFFDAPPSEDLRSDPKSPPQSQGSIRFERHPEHADSLRGELKRMPRTDKTAQESESAWLAGDIEDGELILDESADGQQISAIWVGQALPGSCGKEIRGTRRNAGEDSGGLFILRKTPGWK